MLRYRSGFRQVGLAGGVIRHRMRRVTLPADPTCMDLMAPLLRLRTGVNCGTFSCSGRVCGGGFASVVSHKYGYEDARAFWLSARRDDL